MNFDDTPAEAAFRAEARAWLDANAPSELLEELKNSGFGFSALKSIDPMVAAKAWQKRKMCKILRLPNKWHCRVTALRGIKVHPSCCGSVETLFFSVGPFPGVPSALYRETPDGLIVNRERSDAPLFVT